MDTNFFEQLEGELNDAVAYSELNIALKAISKIKKVLAEENLSLTERQKLESMLPYFQWVAFGSISEEKGFELVRDHLDIALSFPDFDLEEQIAKKVDLLFLEEFQIDSMRRYADAFKNCKAKLGNSPIVIDGQRVEPTIKNWLLDRASFSKNNSGSNLDEVRYLNQSPNCQKLSEEEKQDLLQVIKVYNGILVSIQSYNSLPRTTDEKLAFKDFNLYDWLPGLTVTKPKNIAANSPLGRQRQEILGVGIAATETPKPAAPYTNRQVFNIKKNTEQTSDGIVKIDIDKKLIELKNRVNKKQNQK